MFERLIYEDFCEILNTEFQILDFDEELKLKFFEISEKTENSQAVSFALYLKSPNEVFLPQRIYNLKHEKFGTGELFIVPIRQDADGFVYESVFNRFVEN